ncbi:MAG: phosphoribosylformylglycinamidine cyclo-ligase [Acidimicrobiia bacterium]|nr:phosphoribosylformylglycinamidine cyclo-ligase [Acidimicrobiia bacterium]
MATYKQAGVDIEAADRLVGSIAADVTRTWGNDVVGGFGGFAAGIRIPAGFEHPILMMSTDGVGTKLEIARRHDALDGIGFDLVAMCVDDLAAVGASPLGFTDYIAVGAIDPVREQRIVRSVAAACAAAGCALLGGETAEHPGVMGVDHLDVAGAALGIVEEGHEVTGDGIRPGDAVIGMFSPNLRSNGFSLVRQVFDLDRLHDQFPGDTRSVGDVLTEPSVIYSPAVLAAVATGGVHGLAHITGGGLPGNVGRPLPTGLQAVIDTASWMPPGVFEVVARRGEISRPEMFATFNMGIGFVAVAQRGATDDIIATFAAHGHDAAVIGSIRPGDQPVELAGLS